ncbi:MAG: GTP-binding protein, partial [Candidatus Pacebacteria bacterium]|nr:GTP-binding protein [Candidatus Paceibacterota bacterium]
IEFFSIMRAKKAIEKANLALLVIDGSIGITTQDKKVSEIIQELGVSCIVVVNKKDQMKKDFKDELYKINYLSYAPTIYISALYDRDYKKLFKLIKEVISERNKKISTGELNRFFQDLINYKTPPLSGNKEINLKYIVQANTYNGAVRFIIFTNYPKDVHKSYERFIINRIRGEYSFIGSPIEIVFKKG